MNRRLITAPIVQDEQPYPCIGLLNLKKNVSNANRKMDYFFIIQSTANPADWGSASKKHSPN